MQPTLTSRSSNCFRISFQRGVPTCMGGVHGRSILQPSDRSLTFLRLQFVLPVSFLQADDCGARLPESGIHLKRSARLQCAASMRFASGCDHRPVQNGSERIVGKSITLTMPVLDGYKEWVKRHPGLVSGLDWLLYLGVWNPGRLEGSGEDAALHAMHHAAELRLPLPNTQSSATRHTMQRSVCCLCGTLISWRRTSISAPATTCSWTCFSR